MQHWWVGANHIQRCLLFDRPCVIPPLLHLGSSGIIDYKAHHSLPILLMVSYLAFHLQLVTCIISLANLLLALIRGPYKTNIQGTTVSSAPIPPRRLLAGAKPSCVYIWVVMSGKTPPRLKSVSAYIRERERQPAYQACFDKKTALLVPSSRIDGTYPPNN